MIFSLAHLYVLAGALIACVAAMTAVDRTNPRRFSSAFFWGFYALVFLVGDLLPPAWVGGGVIAMAVIAGLHRVAAGSHVAPTVAQYAERARRLANRLFLPALAIPAVAVAASLASTKGVVAGIPLLDAGNPTLAAIGMSSLVALALACALTRETPAQGVREARRLVDAISWAVVLPQLLATLGLVFSDAGVGKAVAWLTTHYIAMDIRFVAVAVYCLGMALFTIIMGNGFAAFPVMTGGVGVPVLVGAFHVNPAAMAAIGMFSGYCGTLMTPMAANFNIVPAALLELPDKNGVIRAQWPTATAVLVFNIFLLYFLLPKP
ncbi:DUF979 domain-containing protein [Scleromatobacter humisilvae]|uniref:DUF979 domain-containing protein n=1 Tax=Scleromatobacter humisilvae TaxID=2897159 RepID=A0A9X2C1K0_9BURK|nr:DUF979 domain-containing protein [Scleromatobacter humisilvae]MCK9687631.1 DUF979 domain-containing protein [Scleromatobacter humisilvae]